MIQPEFLPTTREEMSALGWDELDILLVSGDAYVDNHSFGISLLGRWLVAHGYKTGIIAQPDWHSADDMQRMGRPKLFAGVSAGSVDSLIAHYTAFRKKRSQDAYTPGGKIDCRPNRASIVYTGLLRQAFPGLPVVLGGIEASLRRASHYDFWSDQLRRSILLDSKADAILYGMGEKSIIELAALFSSATARQRPAAALEQARLKGTVYAVHQDNIPDNAEVLPSHEAILADPQLLIKATLAFERQMHQGQPCLVQRSASRVVVFEPPNAPLTTSEMDRIYSLPFSRKPHPSYTEAIPAVAMLEGSFTSHRGCGGGCSFCSLASHQGRAVQSRSRESLLREVEETAKSPDWKGSITDIGGPTSNMWNAQCVGDASVCKRQSCLYPKRCRYFKPSQEEQVELLRAAANIDGVKHVRVASGVRHDLAMESDEYMQALAGEFTGGQLKIAPEHLTEKVLRLMRKPALKTWDTFVKQFAKLSDQAGKEQYIIPYLMSAFPGCTDEDMQELAAWLKRRGWRPQQVQCFIPSPGTVATAMFYSGFDVDGRPIFVARTDGQRLFQHRILIPDEGGEKARPARSGRDGEFDRFRPQRRDSGRPRPNERRSFDRPKSGERKFGDKPRFGDKKPYGDRREFGDKKPFERRPRSDSGCPTGDRPKTNERRSFSDRPQTGERKFNDRPRSGDAKPFERRPRTDGGRPTGDWPKPYERRSSSERPQTGERKFSGKPRSGDAKPFERRPRSDGGRPTGDRPKPYERRSSSERPQTGERKFGGKPRTGGSKPFGNRPPAAGGKRPFTDRGKPGGGKPRPGGKPGPGRRGGNFRKGGGPRSGPRP